MSFHPRSISARRYRIEGELPSVGDERFSRRLLDRAFHPLSAHEERAFGWVTADNCLDARFEAGSVARGPCAVFALRVDKRRVNGRLLRAMIDLETRGRRKDAERDAVHPEPEGAPQGDGAEADAEGEGRRARRARPPRPGRLSRDERQEIRRQITEELLRNTTPSMEVHPVLVYPREKVVLFGSLGKPANEVFRALFADTFEVTLSALTPYHRALELLEGRGASEALAGLRRTDFHRAFALEPARRERTGSALVPPSIAARSATPGPVPPPEPRR